MLDKALVDKFYSAVRAQGFNDADIAWVLKQHGVDAVEELLPGDAFRIQDFAHNRRKYGRNLVEQWEKFTHC
jgi:glycosylphosphatidylinositol transamidase (GPIT) subunit GPI8